jgi:hypothetical protein
VDAAPAEHVATFGAKTSTHADGELLGTLRRELEIKNQQITQQGELIAKQMELISGLSERLREGNVLMGSLQQRLALTDGRGPISVTPPKPRRTASSRAEKRSIIAANSTKPKRSLLARLFG